MDFPRKLFLQKRNRKKYNPPQTKIKCTRSDQQVFLYYIILLVCVTAFRILPDLPLGRYLSNMGFAAKADVR